MSNTENKFQTKNVIVVAIAHFCHDIYTSFLAPILPLLIDKFSLSYTLAGLMQVIIRLPSLFNPFLGILSARIRVRFFIILAPAVTAIAMSLIGVASHYILLLVLLFVAGVSSTLFHVPTPVMVKMVSGKRVGKGMSFFMVGGELSRTLGPLIIMGAVSLWGLEGTFRLVPFGLIASFMLYFKYKKLDIRKNIKKEEGDKNYLDTFKQFRNTFFAIGGILFFLASVKSSLTFYLAEYLSLQGESPWFWGISLSFFQLSGVIGTYASGQLSDKIGRRKSLLIICLLIPVFMWLFIHSTGFFIFPVLFFLGILNFAPAPVFLSLIHELKTKHLPFVNGIYMTINFILNSTMVILLSRLGDIFTLTDTYKYSVFIAMLSIPFIFILPKDKGVNQNVG